MKNCIKILVLIAVSVGLSGCGLGNQPPKRKSKGAASRPAKKPETTLPPTSTGSKEADPKTTATSTPNGTVSPDATSTHNPDALIGVWTQIPQHPMASFEDPEHVMTWRISRHHITKIARCTLDGKPVTLVASSRIERIANRIVIQNDRAQDKMDENGDKICEVTLTKGPVEFEITDGVLVLRSAKETVALERVKTPDPVSTPPAQP